MSAPATDVVPSRSYLEMAQDTGVYAVKKGVSLAGYAGALLALNCAAAVAVAELTYGAESVATKAYNDTCIVSAHLALPDRLAEYDTQLRKFQFGSCCGLVGSALMAAPSFVGSGINSAYCASAEVLTGVAQPKCDGPSTQFAVLSTIAIGLVGVYAVLRSNKRAANAKAALLDEKLQAELAKTIALEAKIATLGSSNFQLYERIEGFRRHVQPSSQGDGDDNQTIELPFDAANRAKFASIKIRSNAVIEQVLSDFIQWGNEAIYDIQHN